MSTADVRIDEVDLRILKILTYNCRTSYRSIGKTLGISVNTVRTRINNLISNRIIEQFITLVNFSLFGYTDILVILLKASKNRRNVFNKVAKSMKNVGHIYLHIEIFHRFYVFSIAVRRSYFGSNNINSLGKKLYKDLGKNISVHDLFCGKHISLVSHKFCPRRIDFEILECLVSDPRITFLNIARTIGCSQRTIIRRIEKLKSSQAIMGFSMLYNPSKMKGYNYFSVILHTRPSMAAKVTEEISYSELNRYILRFPPFIFYDRVIVIFHIENIFDIESIVTKVRSIKGVLKTETYQPVRIEWHEEWLKEEIRDKIRVLRFMRVNSCMIRCSRAS